MFESYINKSRLLEIELERLDNLAIIWRNDANVERKWAVRMLTTTDIVTVPWAVINTFSTLTTNKDVDTSWNWLLLTTLSGAFVYSLFKLIAHLNDASARKATTQADYLQSLGDIIYPNQ